MLVANFTGKQEKNFSTYLNRIRMEEAKQLLLLLGDEERIYQVAEQVGCSNARYFGQAFKKIYRTDADSVYSAV